MRMSNETCIYFVLHATTSYPVNRDKAIEALEANDWDVDQAIMSIKLAEQAATDRDYFNLYGSDY